MDKREILLALLGRETVSPAASKAAGAVEDLGDAMRATAADGKKLDREIGQAERQLRQLATQYARTDDAAGRMDLTKSMRKQQAEIRRLVGARKLLPPDLGDDEAKGFAAKFVARLGPLVASAPISPHMAAAFVPALAVISGGVAAAVTGGVAAAVAGGGVALAFRDESVKAEASALGAEVGEIMTRAAEPFVPATLAAINRVRAGFHDLEPDLRAMGQDAAKFVEPLTDGLVGGASSLVGSLRVVVRNAEPVVEVLGKHGTQAAAALGTSLELLSQDAEHMGAVLDGMLTTVEGVTIGVSALISGVNQIGGSLGTAEHGVLAFTTLGTVLGSPLILVKELAEWLGLTGEEADAAGAAAAEAAARMNDGFEQSAEEAAEAAAGVETLTDAIRRMSNENLDARAATRAMEEAIDAAAEAAKANGRTLDENTPKGRANAAALDEIAKSTLAARDAIIKTSGSQGEANDVMARGRERFLALAQSMGLGSTEAKRLADQLFGIPSVNPKVRVDAAGGKAAVEDFLRKYEQVKNRSVTISGKVRWTSTGLKVPGGTILEKARGGAITGPGPKGVDSVALLAAPGEHVLTAREVDAAGGHEAIERWRRSLVSGRGGATAPAVATPVATATATDGHRTYNITVMVPPTANAAEVGRQTVEAIRAYEQRSGAGWRS